MRLSSLQKFILLKCLEKAGQKTLRKVFVEFYKGNVKIKKEARQKIITGSLESLIDKELLIGYGRRTPHKWFIEQVKLTGRGQKESLKLLGEQKRLPLK
ncbi:TPA: hypothetical protein DF272_03930 [Candidatus Falkowbacteria bacterium]|nr:hypothetical protein [Candidatus Falkowbacteria bacterium]